MKKLLSFTLILFVSIVNCMAQQTRSVSSFDDDWVFHLGDVSNGQSDDFKGKKVTLPHDWDIESKINAANPTGGGGGFFPGGIGWYRKTFDIPVGMADRKISLEFEGVYMNADVWVNGTHVVNQPYGYTSFIADITKLLKTGKNTIDVKVDNSQQRNSRWYSGSGIYRHVWLVITPQVHIAPYGVFFYTQHANSTKADVSIKTSVANEGNAGTQVTVQSKLVAPDGRETPAADQTFTVNPDNKQEVTQQVTLNRPTLWTPEIPLLYKLVSRVVIGGKVTDEITTKVGVRELAWSAKGGFTINGRVYKLNGGCIHHDNGVLGAAAFDRAEIRKVQLLKTAGFNELRTAHNPPSPELLHACDSLGMLVLDEAFDCWSKGKNAKDYSLYFKDWWQKDLDAMVFRDRSHPSVIMWSIGNEIPGSMDPEIGGVYGKQLADRVRQDDPTRPVTQALLGLPKTASDSTVITQQRNALDIVGCNYNMEAMVKDEANNPQRVLIGTESMPDNPTNMLDFVANNTFVVGDNVWTAMDYLGESGIGRSFYEGDPTEPVDTAGKPIWMANDKLYPWHGGVSGDLDILGFSKPTAHYRNIAWGRGEKLYMGVRQPDEMNDHKLIQTGWNIYPVWESWTYPGMENKFMDVEVYTRYPKVQLYLNDQLVAEKDVTIKDKFKVTFQVPYTAGVLKAVGVADGKPAETVTLATADKAVALRLTPDKKTIKADGQDLSYITVEAVDKNGNLQPNANQQVVFNLQGFGLIQGLGNANLKSEEPYTGTQCHLYHGRALIVIRSIKDPGAVVLNAQAAGLKATVLLLSSVK
jgi:beta-galactosidase